MKEAVHGAVRRRFILEETFRNRPIVVFGAVDIPKRLELNNVNARGLGSRARLVHHGRCSSAAPAAPSVGINRVLAKPAMGALAKTATPVGID
jgi:hypothetical protein